MCVCLSCREIDEIRMFFTKLAEKTGILDILAPPTKSPPPKKKKKYDSPTKYSMQQTNSDAERVRRLRGQADIEKNAEKFGHLAKKQRVKYYHKMSDTYHDAFIVGVHFDDGPDRPYYVRKNFLRIISSHYYYYYYSYETLSKPYLCSFFLVQP